MHWFITKTPKTALLIFAFIVASCALASLLRAQDLGQPTSRRDTALIVLKVHMAINSGQGDLITVTESAVFLAANSAFTALAMDSEYRLPKDRARCRESLRRLPSYSTGMALGLRQALEETQDSLLPREEGGEDTALIDVAPIVGVTAFWTFCD